MNKSGKYLVWTVLSVMGAFALGYIALNRGEQINALWIVVASVCIYLIAYRFYGLYIAKNVLAVDPTRMTPAVRHNDGLDYVPTDKKVLFGHHFAAIAGAGPLVGPVLAAQMGYLPGMIWLLAGVVLAGAVQDFMVLFVSTRRDGRSLGELVKEEMGPTAGVIALVACFMIMVIILAVLAMIVVKALTHSPWGTYTVAFTIPLAIFMGIYLRYLRPGRIGEVSVIGLVFLIFAIISGGWVAESPTWAPYFDFTGVQLTWMLVGYGFVAAVLPVWLLLAPRDYLSTFLKIGTIVGLAVGILIMRPTLTMPALTKFVDGTGPVTYRQLLAPVNSISRYKTIEWLNYIATELHKGFTPLFRPDTPEEYKPTVRAQLEKKLQYVNEALKDEHWICGQRFTIADAYLFTVLRWAYAVKLNLEGLEHIAAFMQRMAERPEVQDALSAEGLK